MEKEQTQEGAVEEQVKEEISTPVSETASTEEKATSEKDDEWKRMMQSRADKAESKSQKLESELQNLRKEREQQRFEARQKEIAALADEPDEQAKLRRRHELEDANRKLEEENQVLYEKVWKKYDQSISLANQYDLSPADARELMNADTPREMELLAQIKVAEQAKISKAPPKETKEGFPKPDSGTSDAGSDDDEAFMKRYSDGKSDDHARAQKILAKIK
jgi:hypothetical protein